MLYTNQIFFVYVYLDPRKNDNFVYGKFSFLHLPFYVGKGKGRRHLAHLKNSVLENDKNKMKVNKIKKIIKEGSLPIIFKIKENLTKKEAINLEIGLIKSIGRIDLGTGPLCNLTDGGESGNLSPVSIEKLRNKKIGHTVSVSTREKLRAANLGKKLSEETCLKMKKIRKGINNPNSRWVYKLTDPDENVYNNIINLKEFCEKHNLSYSSLTIHLRREAKGQLKTTDTEKVWHIVKKSKNKFIYDITDPNGVLYENIHKLKSFCKNNNLNYNNMRYLLNRKPLRKKWKIERRPKSSL